MNTSAQSSALVAFLSGAGRDHAGRRLDDVLAYSDADLERHHDFIQWLFPLPTPSGAVPGSPVLTPADIAAITGSPACQAAIERARARMAAFYGGTTHWLVFHDHNHLRISRIIASTRLLSGQNAAAQFHDEILALVKAAGGPVSTVSQRYWRQALDG
jgi:hypothetical protein